MVGLGGLELPTKRLSVASSERSVRGPLMGISIIFDDTSWMGSMPAKPVDFKERTSRRALRAARKEGFIITGQEVLKDGTFRLLFGGPSGQAAPSDQEIDPNANPEKPSTRG